MKLNDPFFKISEEVLEVIFHFKEKNDNLEESLIYATIDKTPTYVKKGLDLLIQLNIILKSGNCYTLNRKDGQLSHPIATIKKALTVFKPFKEYVKLVQNSKKENSALKIIKTTYQLENNVESLKKIFNKYIKFLETDIKIVPLNKNEVTSLPTEKNFFWIDEFGHLIYDEESHTNKIINDIESKRYRNPLFIDNSRIDNLKLIKSESFDLSKLIKLAEELNDAYRVENYHTVGILTRAILDHIPPIFEKRSFAEVANNYGSKSFKAVMLNLENFSRKIADGILHSQIRKKENLPNATTIDCKNAFDILLGEIINKLN